MAFLAASATAELLQGHKTLTQGHSCSLLQLGGQLKESESRRRLLRSVQLHQTQN